MAKYVTGKRAKSQIHNTGQTIRVKLKENVHAKHITGNQNKRVAGNE